MKNEQEPRFYRPEISKELQGRLKRLSIKSGIELRVMLTTALENFADARERLFGEIEKEK